LRDSGINAKRHDCQRNALLAVIAGCDGYVEGILQDPQVQQYAPAWMRNGARHAWCIKDGQLIDPSLNAHVVPEIAQIGAIQPTSVYRPLAVLTRGQIMRALAISIEHVWEVIDGLAYDVPEGVAGWQGEDVAGGGGRRGRRGVAHLRAAERDRPKCNPAAVTTGGPFAGGPRRC
jgi:hypothetical protein